MVLSSRPMRKPWLLVGFALLLLVALRGPLRPRAPGAALSGHVVVVTAVADLLERPDERAPLADQALLGHGLTVLGPAAGGLIQVQTVSGYRGYAPVAALLPQPSQGPPYGHGPAVEVVARLALLYAEPDVTRRRPLLAVPLGVRLALSDPAARTDEGRWIAVRLPDGRPAFVQRGDVQLVGAAPRSAACVVQRALQHEGSPYLWGGRSTLGIDCSGLVSNAYGDCGIVVPRDAGPQHGWSELIPVPAGAPLLPGDLLFFGQPQVTHVGIALGGEAFVHATTADRPDVHRSRLSEGTWQQQLVGVRRHPKLLR